MIIANQSGHTFTSYQKMQENFLRKYIRASEDKTIDKEECLSRARSISKARLVTNFSITEPICFGATVEWLRCYFESAAGGFDCDNAAKVHRRYMANVDYIACTAEKKYDLAQKYLYEILTREMKLYKENVAQEGADFNHIKSMTSCLSGFFLSVPKGAAVVILHTGVDKGGFIEYQGHTFVLAMDSKTENAVVTDKLILFDGAGFEFNWQRGASEMILSFIARALNEITILIESAVIIEKFKLERFNVFYVFDGIWPDILNVD